MTDYSAVFLVFLIAWLGLGLASWLYVRSRDGAEAKLRAHRALTILSAAIFLGFVVWAFPRGALFMVPAVLVITWLNVRNTRFCDGCGRMMQGFTRTDFCPRCGAGLRGGG